MQKQTDMSDVITLCVHSPQVIAPTPTSNRKRLVRHISGCPVRLLL